jgi:hypothetical protein
MVGDDVCDDVGGAMACGMAGLLGESITTCCSQDATLLHLLLSVTQVVGSDVTGSLHA